MKNAVLNQNASAVKSDEFLKLTALVYFEEALFKEEYESCAELIDIARKFGAGPSDIKEVIATFIRNKSGGKSEAKQKNRLR